MGDIKEIILQFMKEKGPILPADIAKHINTDILIASAHLSELSSNGKLKISKVKVGGSPLYFLAGQENQLQNFADNLHEKEKKAYDLLSQKKILKDNELEPVVRVALRAIKDYAVPLQVNFKGNSEIFWRWYLVTNKEAEELIRPVVKERKPAENQKTVEPSREISEKTTVPEREIPERTKTLERKPAIEGVPKTGEVQKKIQGRIIPERHIEKPIPALPKKTEKRPKTDNNLFLTNISNYFGRNKINILSREVIRKTEIDFLIQVPSAVGNLEYYCKAKNKKKINDSDLASAFAQGQLRKLPVMIITTGELTKRAKEMLQKDFKGMGIKQL